MTPNTRVIKPSSIYNSNMKYPKGMHKPGDPLIAATDPAAVDRLILLVRKKACDKCGAILYQGDLTSTFPSFLRLACGVLPVPRNMYIRAVCGTNTHCTPAPQYARNPELQMRHLQATDFGLRTLTLSREPNVVYFI